MGAAGERLTLPGKLTPLDDSPSEARVSTNTHTRKRFSNTKLQQPNQSFCSHQFGTMTMTCALLMLCMTTTLWSTPLRQRTGCLRSSTTFTVSYTTAFYVNSRFSGSFPRGLWILGAWPRPLTGIWSLRGIYYLTFFCPSPSFTFSKIIHSLF